MLSTGLRMGFEAYITRIDGTRYTEHQIEGLPLSTNCYLQSEEEKEFSIHLDASPVVGNLHPRHDWIIAFRVDGRLIHQIAHRKGVIGVKCSELHSEEGGRIVEGRLVFAKVPTTDDNNQVTLIQEAKNGLGEVRVDIYDGRYDREFAWTRPVLAKTEVGVAKESKGKRIGCTSVTSKTPYTVPKEAKEVKFVYNDPSRPFFSFVFLHRSKLALQALDIVPPDPNNHRPAVITAKKRKRTGVIAIDCSDSEDDAGEGGSDSDDSETDRMHQKMAELERKIRLANKRNRGRRPPPEDIVDLMNDDQE